MKIGSIGKGNVGGALTRLWRVGSGGSRGRRRAARDRRGLGQRAHPRLPDVPLRARTAGLALFGLVGGPLIILSGTLVLFDVFDQGDTAQGLASIPEDIWEFGLGVYATFWGFRASSPILGREGAVPS